MMQAACCHIKDNFVYSHRKLSAVQEYGIQTLARTGKFVCPYCEKILLTVTASQILFATSVPVESQFILLDLFDRDSRIGFADKYNLISFVVIRY